MHNEKMPVDFLNERHYTIGEIAEMWQLSLDKIRRIFQKEAGVLALGRAQPEHGRRRYVTLRVPEGVLRRVHEQLSTETKIASDMCGVPGTGVPRRVDTCHSLAQDEKR